MCGYSRFIVLIYVIFGFVLGFALLFTGIHYIITASSSIFFFFDFVIVIVMG